MGANKKFPESDDSKEESMAKTLAKHNAIVPPAASIIKPANSAALSADLPIFVGKRTALANADAAYNEAGQEVAAGGILLKNMTSSGMQLVGFKVFNKFPGFTTATFTFYKMPESGNIPEMKSEAQILQTAKDFFTGETSRIAAGGTALVDISKSDVETLMNDFIAKQLARDNAKEASVKAQQALKAYREDVVEPLIINLWNDISDATHGMTRGAAHDFGTSWGMIYGPSTGSGSIMVQVLNATDGNIPLGGASVRVGAPDGKAGAKGITNAMGIKVLESSNFEPTFVVVEMPGFVKQSIPVTVIEGDEITLTVRLERIPKQ